MTGVVETQRLISLSLGKIARSRSQRGGINLHKNLLVASVLNKARTAFMIENYNYQQVKTQQVVLTTPQPSQITTPVSPAPESEPRDGNSLSAHVSVVTCQATTPDTESRSTPVDNNTVVSGPVCSNNSPSVQIENITMSSQQKDKENIFPTENSVPVPVCQQNSSESQLSVSGQQHIEAANQLSLDAQVTNATGVSCNNTLGTSLCKQQTSASTTCLGVLKRRRDNPECNSISESDCHVVSKKARVSSDSDNSKSCGDYSRSCEYESESDSESDNAMHTSDSPQISNLVSIFNSGFSGLCVSSSTSSSLEYENGFHSDNSASHQWSSARNQSDSQSLCCSSQVERIGSLSSAIVLSA